MALTARAPHPHVAGPKRRRGKVQALRGCVKRPLDDRWADTRRAIASLWLGCQLFLQRPGEGDPNVGLYHDGG